MRKKFITTAIAVAALAGLAIPASADAKNGGHVRKVRLQDRCDPATFNAEPPVGPGLGDICAPHSGQLITFADFAAALATGGSPKWNFHPDMIDLRMGDSISASVRGGEFHTFTEVPMFGPGCVPFINEALGFGKDATPVVDCALAGPTGTAPGLPPVVVSASDLSPGVPHKFMCLIHPWMRSVVTVEGDDD